MLISTIAISNDGHGQKAPQLRDREGDERIGHLFRFDDGELLRTPVRTGEKPKRKPRKPYARADLKPKDTISFTMDDRSLQTVAFSYEVR